MNSGLLGRLRSLLSTKQSIAFLLLGVGLVAAWFFGWMEWVALSALLACVAYIVLRLVRQRRDFTASHTLEVNYTHYQGDDTAELPVVSRMGISRPPKKNDRQIKPDETGQNWLVYERHEYNRQRLFGKKSHTITKGDIRLHDSPLVKEKLVRRSSFEPIASEEEIFVYRRFDWMSHAPAQIGVTLVTGMAVALLLYGFSVSIVEPILAAVGIVIVLLVGAVAYLYYWIPWAYLFLIATDDRILKYYHPPLWLKRQVQVIDFSQISYFNEFDQHRFFTWVREKFGLPAYGVIGGDTPSQDGDEWIRRTEATDEADKEAKEKVHRGIRYVPQYKDVKQVLDTRLASRRQAVDDRHQEDMDFKRRQAEAAEEQRDLQRRQAEAAEETRDLMRELAKRPLA